MKTLSVVGVLALVVFITAQPEVQISLFNKVSTEFTLIGFGLFGFWMLAAAVDTIFDRSTKIA